MKNIFVIFLIFLIPFGAGSQVITEDNADPQNSSSRKGTINILSSQDLYSITKMWARDYEGINPKVKISVSSSDLKISDQVLPRGTDIGIYAKRTDVVFADSTLWKMVIGRDVIVPVINSKNPLMAKIAQSGISASEIAKIFESPDNMVWGTLLGDNDPTAVKFYVIDDEALKSDVADFLSVKKLLMADSDLNTGKEVIEAVQNDPYALGFCRMSNILGDSNKDFLENISLMPIDKNSNGVIDYHEMIFDDYDAFTRGVWIGKYPKSLYQNIYSIAEKKPDNEAVIAFLKWVVTSGQEKLTDIGYADLVYSEKKSNMEALIVSGIVPKDPKRLFVGQKILALVLGLFLVTGILASLIVSLLARRKESVEYDGERVYSIFNENSVEVLNGLYFDKTHTWAFMDQNGGVKIGIDDFLQHVTGPITRVKLKMPGERIGKGDKVMTIIQKGKRLSIYSPVSGVIVEQNEDLFVNSSMLNSSPYSDGWAYKIEPTNWLKETQVLIRGDKYKNWLKDEFTRLKDFLAIAIKGKSMSAIPLVLQDGGEIRDCVLADCGPEIWEDFQTNFIDTHK